MYQNRPGRVALFAVLTELVVIVATGNQAATRAITRHVGAAPRGFANHALDSLRTFSWRFSPLSGVPAQHAWGAQFAGIGAVLLLTYLIVLIISRRAGIGQTFVGTWAGVVAATVVGVVVRGVVYPFPLRGGSRLSVAVFGFPNGAVTFFGFALGLVVALVATLAMIITRKPVAAPGDEAPQAAAEPAFFDAAPGGYLTPGAGGYEQPPPFDRPAQQPAPMMGGPSGGGYAAGGYPPAPHDSPAAGPDYSSAPAAPEDSPAPAAPAYPSAPESPSAPGYPSAPSVPDSPPAPGYPSAPSAPDSPPAPGYPSAPDPEPTETITPYTGGEQRTTVLPEVPTEGESQSAEPGPDAGQHRHN